MLELHVSKKFYWTINYIALTDNYYYLPMQICKETKDKIAN